jgi:hypothetical protein
MKWQSGELVLYPTLNPCWDQDRSSRDFSHVAWPYTARLRNEKWLTSINYSPKRLRVQRHDTTLATRHGSACPVPLSPFHRRRDYSRDAEPFIAANNSQGTIPTGTLGHSFSASPICANTVAYLPAATGSAAAPTPTPTPAPTQNRQRRWGCISPISAGIHSL